MYESLITKLNRQHRQQPIVAFLDFDGTLYPGSRSLWKAPFYNRRTSRILQELHIPIIIVTGRGDWTFFCEKQMLFFGIKEDAVAAGAGSEIYVRGTDNKLQEDMTWDTHISRSMFTWKDAAGKEHTEKWDEYLITGIATKEPSMRYLRLARRNQNKYAIRFTVKNLPIHIVEMVKSKLKQTFPQGIKILVAEKLFVKNTQHIYSGDILLVPSTAGKNNAVEYILTKLSQASGKKLTGFVFGDSSIDIKMLTMPDHPEYYNIIHYGVDLTPRAHTILNRLAKKVPNLYLSNHHGPEIIYQTFKHLLQHQ